MKVLIAGSNGMIGSATTRYLSDCAHEVFRLVRHATGQNEIRWDPDKGEIDSAGLEGFDGVVHLATAPWPMRWSSQAKKTMLANRLATNGLLAKSLACCERKPEVLICASGMGYYPSSGDEFITEDSPSGTSFLSQFQQAGEVATAPASAAGIRVVNLRIPMVLGGQALKRVGFQAGNGQQWVSWVGRAELASIIEFVLTHEEICEPVNAVSPNPVRQVDFAAISTQTLGIKPGGKMPANLVRLIMGEMGEELVLASRRMQPAKLLAAGYQFRFADLSQAVLYEMTVSN
jgi:uncharacterized protein (TIGR01777 family)